MQPASLVPPCHVHRRGEVPPTPEPKESQKGYVHDERVIAISSRNARDGAQAGSVLRQIQILSSRYALLPKYHTTFSLRVGLY